MEELSVYRYRIGQFSGVAYRKSNSGKILKRPLRSQSPSKLKRKVSKQKETKQISQEYLERKRRRRPCRLGLLFLIIVLVVLCTRNGYKSSTEKTDYIINDQYTAYYSDIPSSLEIRSQNERRYSRNMSFLQYHGSPQTDTTTALWKCVYTHALTALSPAYLATRPRTGLKNGLVEPLNNKTISVKKDPQTNVSNRNNLLKDFVLSLIYLIGDFNDAYVLKTLYVTCNITIKYKDSSSASHICFTGIRFHADFMVMTILLCCLGTCCYLLGNKGVHCYNGNPKRRGM